MKNQEKVQELITDWAINNTVEYIVQQKPTMLSSKPYNHINL